MININKSIVILGAGSSTRFLSSKPTECTYSSKLLCEVNSTPIICNLMHKLSSIRLGSGNTIYVVLGSNNTLYDVINEYMSNLNKPYNAKVKLVRNTNSDIDSNLISLYYAYKSGANLNNSIIIDGDTYLDDEYFNHIVNTITKNNYNTIFTTNNKRASKEWSVVETPDHLVTEINTNPISQLNITTGITNIHCNKLNKYVSTIIKSNTYPPYWDQFYLESIQDKSLVFYNKNINDGIIREVDTYQDYIDILNITNNGGK